MNTEGRMTRSRARTMDATGQTPSLADLPGKTPVTRTTRRTRAAAGEAAPTPAAGFAPVVLFDVPLTDTAAEEAAAAPAPAPLEALTEEPASRPDSPRPEQAAASTHLAAAAGDEPPNTPAHAQRSPAPAARGATPTGLGLSGLLPLSPTLATALASKTPAATPMGGAQADAASKVHDALHAAAEALNGKSEGSEDAELVFRGFGSPLKPADSDIADSPVPAVSIGGAIPAASPAAGLAQEGEEITSVAAGVELAFERELTLEEMMGSPAASDREGTPTLQAAPVVRPAATPVAAAAAGRTPVLARTAPRAHPLTPSRQVVLEDGEEDYIMTAEEEELAAGAELAEAAAAAELAYDDDDMSADEQQEEAAAPSPPPAAVKPRLQSKVVVPSPNTFDPRSLRQLKKEVSDRLAAKQVAAFCDDEAEEEEYDENEDYVIGTAGGEELADALGGLSLETGAHGPLRGMPTPKGSHIRFDDECEVAAVSPRQRVFLRGLPQPEGTHIHFDE